MLIFDISGRFAHFRKYDTNSSSLTYLLPPRTTICGLIAAILGLERNQYYGKFIPDQARIGVRLLNPGRKCMQSLNYLKLEQTGDFTKPRNHTQIPFEVLTSKDQIRYRIYFEHEDKELMEELDTRLKEHRYCYPPYLGPAPFQCSVKRVDFRDNEVVEGREKLPVSTAINVSQLEEGSVDFTTVPLKLARERMPRYFQEDRYLEEAAAYLVELNGSPIPARINGEVRRVRYADQEEYITFM